MDWTPILQQLILIVVIPLLGALGTYAVLFIRKKSAELQAKLEADNLAILNSYVAIGETTVTEAVNYIKQTIVDNIKNTEAWTDEKKKEVLEAAKKRALELMTEATKQAIVELKGDIETWIETRVEATVQASKAPATEALPYAKFS